MTSVETITLALPHSKATEEAGASLAATVYGMPLTIGLTGDLGSGKTSFFRGFAQALGITENVTSPTYALEQRYWTERFGEILHLDLYRLKKKEALDLIKHSDHHSGIRVIEWSDRIKDHLSCNIDIHLEEDTQGRTLTCAFCDVPIPSSQEIKEWRMEMMLPEHVARHCDVVADTALDCAKHLMHRRYLMIRLQALHAAGQLHDLFRFLDFRQKAGTQGYEHTPEHDVQWKKIRSTYPGLRHEAACTRFLCGRGYEAIGTIVETHGVQAPPAESSTIEQKLLYYADKRVALDKRVTLDERFADFRARYGEGKDSEDAKIWYKQAKELEDELKIEMKFLV